MREPNSVGNRCATNRAAIPALDFANNHGHMLETGVAGPDRTVSD